ncbi:MAG: outer membrane lipoprotein-sorting protein [Woeseia sp.]
MFLDRQHTERFFRRVTARPVLTLVLGVLVIAFFAAGLTRLVKDTSIEAFIPDDHPSLLANDRAEEIFGISKPIVVAVMTDDGGSVFRPAILDLMTDLTEQVAALPNIRPDRVSSIATESSIAGRDGELLVESYIPHPGLSELQAADAARRWRAMPPHISALVSEDEDGALIIAELIDDNQAADTYDELLAMAAAYSDRDVEILVSGPAAVSGYLGAYIDRDARMLQPMVFLVVLSFIYLAFRRTTALIAPVIVILGSAGGALGLMAWAGTPYFAITNALPVILVAISVADAIHILSAYYVLRAQDEKGDVRGQVILAMVEMARPVTLTTLTTMAGFAGIGLASIMPPIEYFAWYAALGVALAWAFSILVLPNILLLLQPAASPAFSSWQMRRPDPIGSVLARFGIASIRRPWITLTLFALAIVVASVGAAQLRVDRSQVENFSIDEPVRIADERINQEFAGTALLDVVIDADEPEGLLGARAMAKILALQEYFETLPHVQKTASIADYVGLLHGAIEATATTRELPVTDDAIGQYLFVYEVSGDPTDFEEEIDYGYQTALVRGVLNAHLYSQTRQTVEALQYYIETEFNEPGLTATLAGDVNINYHWMSRLEDSHFLGVGLSLLMVLVISSLVFGTVHAGMVAVVPVSFTVLVLYGVMGFAGVHLAPATSMFAAISVGVGVDFAIHLIDRLRQAMARYHGNLEQAVAAVMPGTARACFFNAMALGLGFAVLMSSELPTLQRFGGLVTVAAFASFGTALCIVPALFAANEALRGTSLRQVLQGVTRCSLLMTLIAGALAALSTSAMAEPDGREIAAMVEAREEGGATRRIIQMTLTSQRGRQRERTAVVLKHRDEESRKTRITYTAPKRARGISFLSHDYPVSDRADDRWLYTPAIRKVRRIPATERGKSFQGTDFSYEDVQSDLKFDLDDYRFSYLGRDESAGAVRHRISGKPVSAAIARELGYGGFDAVVDETSWLPVRIDFTDPHGEPLKTVTISDIRYISGYWTATLIEAVNHQTGHRTTFHYEDVSYPDSLAGHLFVPGSLQRGLP